MTRRAPKQSSPMSMPQKEAPPPSQGFPVNQLRKLQKPLGEHHVHVREAEGKQLSYIEGWYAIAQANEIFGYAGWDREIVFFERTLETTKPDITTCGYIARVRVRVRAGSVDVSREGTGWGFAASRHPHSAHERALKAAETDATKRALSTFGAQFGLSLYDKERDANPKACKFVIFAPNGQPFADNLSAEAFATGMRQLIEKCERPAEINALMVWNNGSLGSLRISAPDLRNRQGLHFTDILLRLAERAIRRLEAAPLDVALDAETAPKAVSPSPPNATPTQENVPNGVATAEPAMEVHAKAALGPVSLSVGFENSGRPAITAVEEPGNAKSETVDTVDRANPDMASRIGVGERIDKSALPLGFARRVRSKLHLRRVAELPCLICNRQPSHAHHVKFAQRRGLSQKVSDEFVVPLCALHHGDLHRAASERDWWQKQGHDPLAIAAGLWDRFGRNLH